MPYSNEMLSRIYAQLDQVPSKAAALREAYVLRSYTHERGREYAAHGFGRRLSILQRCIQKVFSILPPEQTALPGREQLLDADLHLHAFVFNNFGALDNLAWIWVYERLTGPGLREIQRRDVSLHHQSASIRRTFSPAFQAYLGGLSSWFDLQENFRHALGHRIPLYVPPYAVPTSRHAEYESLGHLIRQAIENRDFVECDRLETAQRQLALFQPHMIHSIEERATPVAFHPQLLADFMTIEEIALKMLVELG